MTDMTAVRRAVDRLLAGEPGSLLELLADDVELELAAGGEHAPCRQGSGRQAVADYFTSLGGLLAFWQLDYTAEGRQVIAWGRESFTVAGCGVEGACEFALVFDLAADGRITRLLAIEDLRTFIRHGELVAAMGPSGRAVSRCPPGSPGGRRRAGFTRGVIGERVPVEL
jgi:ketosteroid isomerase-like protein